MKSAPTIKEQAGIVGKLDCWQEIGEGTGVETIPVRISSWQTGGLIVSGVCIEVCNPQIFLNYPHDLIGTGGCIRERISLYICMPTPSATSSDTISPYATGLLKFCASLRQFTLILRVSPSAIAVAL